MALLVTHARTDIFSTVKIANCALLAWWDACIVRVSMFVQNVMIKTIGWSARENVSVIITISKLIANVRTVNLVVEHVITYKPV
jgi:hypothetical protein